MMWTVSHEISNDAIHWHGVETVRKTIEADLARALSARFDEVLMDQIQGTQSDVTPRGIQHD